MAHSYDVGTRAWQPDATEGWVASEVEAKNVQGDKVKLVFQLATGEVCFALCLRLLIGMPATHSPLRRRKPSKPPLLLCKKIAMPLCLH